MNSRGFWNWVVGTSLLASLCASTAWAQGPASSTPPESGHGPFRRVASFPVFLNTEENVETAAEIVAAADGGNLLVYTDSPTGNVGFVDIADPAHPWAAGVVAVGGQPTSVAVLGNFALACVNTSPDHIHTSGNLQVIDVHTRQIARTIALGGQPDAIAISPRGEYAAIVIENERDENLGSGAPPQAPPGFIVIVDLVGAPSNWTTRLVDLVGVPDLYPDDPEPEFVDISESNIAAVTLQENNHVVLIRLSDGQIVRDFSAGTVDLDGIDTVENDLIEQVSSLANVPREPDAIAWTSPFTFATANEGDLFGGSRGFTIWTPWGNPVFDAGNSIEHAVARIGHYPEDRSENKGNETEGVEFAPYGNQNFLFVGCERSNVVLVYRLFANSNSKLVQVLPTGAAPEGLLAIPERDLFVTANETDDRGAAIRSTIMIYERAGQSSYPTIVSSNRTGTSIPIPWGALSGLASNPVDDNTIHTIHDGFYRQSRIYKVDRSQSPARITKELVLHDSGNLLLDSLSALKAQLPGTDDFVPTEIVNADGTVNLDLEAIAMDLDGFSFWLASEGAGNLVNGVSNPASEPFRSPNVLIQYVNSPGFPPFVPPFDLIGRVVTLPVELTREQFRFGIEGIAPTGHKAAGKTFDLYVCFQRAWQDAGDPPGFARIGRYNFFNQTWTFAYYPLDTATSPNGGWVGLSELTHLGDDRFAVVERDNQGGPDARIKRIYEFSIAGVQFLSHAATPNLPVLQKSLALDLIAADVYGPTGGPIPEKLEGMCALSNGSALIVNDNDGVVDNNGETELIKVDGVFH